MENAICTNETHYSSNDIQSIVQDIYALSKQGTVKSGLAKGWIWKFGSSTLPIPLHYWRKPEDGDIQHPRIVQSYNHSLKRTDSFRIPGPWYVKDRPRRHRRNSEQRLHVLPLKKIVEMLPPLEALTLSMKDAYLPSAAVLQLVCRILEAGGLSLQHPEKRQDAYGPKDVAGLYRFVSGYIENTKDRVRILSKIEDPPEKRKLSTEESLRRTLDTYESGGNATGMRGKLWTIRNKAEEFAKYYDKTEVQRLRAEKKGGIVEKHKDPGDMLRELAAEYDRRYKR